MSKFSLLYLTADAIENFTTGVEIEIVTHGIDSVYSPLAKAAIDGSRTVTSAMNGYFVSGDAEKFHREVISALMDFTQIYDDWIKVLQSPDLKHAASKTLHSMLLRYAKGAVKAYRCWKIDCQKAS